MSGPPTRPPPGAGTQPFDPRPPTAAPPSPLRRLPYLFAAGAVLWLVQLAQFAAIVAAPNGRDELHQAMVRTGVRGDLSLLFVVELFIVFFFVVAAAALHGMAFFGLRAVKPWGWVAALIVSAGWSLVLIGIPVLYVLAKTSTRRAYGIP